MFSHNPVTCDLEVWPFTPTTYRYYVAIHIYVSYQITSPSDIASCSYSWKLANFAKVLWPLTLNLDLSTSLCYGSICPFMAIHPTKFQNHWTFLAKVMAKKCNFWPKFSDLWPWTLTYHHHYVMGVFVYPWQSFPPNFITTEHSSPKLWPENVIFCPISVTFDLWPWANLPKN